MKAPGRRRPSIAALNRQIATLRQRQLQAERTLQAIYNVSLACRGHSTYRAVFDAIYRELQAIFTFDACYIAVCAADSHEMFRAALMVDEGEFEYIENTSYGHLTGIIIREQRPLLFDDLAAERAQLSDIPSRFGNQQRLSRAWVGVPLSIGSDAVGVLSIQSYQPAVYSPADRDLLQEIGNVLALALENVMLDEQQHELSEALQRQIAARTEELHVLSAVAAELALQQPLPLLLDRALDLILRLLNLDGGNVRLLDPVQGVLMLTAQRGFSEEYTRQTARSPLATSPLRDVVIERRPRVFNRDWYSQLNPERFARADVFPRFESLLSVPLISRDQVLGALSLFGYQPHEFDTQVINLAQAIANQLAIGIENARLLAERERQIGELRALSSVSRAASAAFDLPTLLRQVHDALKSFVNLDAFNMVIYDPEREVVTDGISIDDGQEYAYWSNQPPPARSLTEWIINHRAPLHFQNLPQQIGDYADLELHTVGAKRTALSWLGVPLIDRETRVVGVIAVQSYLAAAFDERDEYLLNNIAGQVTLQVQNVRLLTQRERQIRELDAIGQIGQLISASFDRDEMMTGVYQVLQHVTAASVFFLLICDQETGIVTSAVFFEEGVAVPLDVTGRPLPDDSMSTWILNQREPLLFHDLPLQHHQLDSRGITPLAVGPANPVRSWIGVPLLARGGDPIGILSLQDYRPYRYDAQTIDFLTQVASHVSLGIQKVLLFAERERQLEENTRLFREARAHAEAVEKQAHRMELVHRITSLVSTRLDQQEILDVASKELLRLFYADHTGTVLFDERGAVGRVVAEHPPLGAVGRSFSIRDNLLQDELIATRRPVCITDVANDPRTAASREIMLELGIAALMVVPLVSRDRVIGSMSIDSIDQPRAFGPDEQELFLTVATSVAAAVENARLFAAEQEARRTADTLREVARVLSASFDPREVLQLILRELQKVIPYDTASITLLDGNILRIAESHGWASGASPRGNSFRVESSGAGQVVRKRAPVVIDDTDCAEVWARDDYGAHIRSWLGVPLITRGRVLGVLNIDARTERRFSERDVDVAQAFANQAAVAIENAQLYQESVTRVEQELEIARQIQSNLFPRSLPVLSGLRLAAECRPARETGGDFYDLIQLGSRRLAIVVGDVSGKSIPAAMLMAVARSVARSEANDHENPEKVMSEVNRWIADDVPPATFVALNYATFDCARRRLTLASAGQMAPIRRSAAGQLTYLEPPGPALPLGIAPIGGYRPLEVPLQPGDTLVFYTDGVVEARNSARELFGFERLEALLTTDGHLPPQVLVERVLGAVTAFADGAPQHDDITVVVLGVE